jgi:hypothetical protein
MLMDRRDGTEAAISAGNLGEREIHRKQIAMSNAPSREARPFRPRDLGNFRVYRSGTRADTVGSIHGTYVQRRSM